MKIGNNVKKAGALLGVMTIILVGTFSAFSTDLFDRPIEEPKPTYPIDHLSIDASFLLKTDETNESVNVSCDLFMTNIWEKESGEIKATAYVIEKNTNLAVYKNTVEFGTLAANSTTELNIPLEFSDNSYNVEILIFEKDKMVLKGKLSITSRQRYTWNEVGDRVYISGYTASADFDDDQWDLQNTILAVNKVH